MATLKVNRNGYLAIDFRYKNRRYVYSTGLKDTKENRHKAQNKLNAIKGDISHGNLDLPQYFPQILKSPDTGAVNSFFDFYIREKTLRPGSLSNLLSVWPKHIQPYFGDMQLRAVTPHDVRVFRNKLIDDGKLKTGNINHVMIYVAGIFSRTFDEGLIAKYPCKRLGKLKEERVMLQPLSFEDLRVFLKFLQEKKPEFYDMIYVWSRCGFRHGEILTTSTRRSTLTAPCG